MSVGGSKTHKIFINTSRRSDIGGRNMAHRIPIQQDDLSFEERQNKIWEDMEKDMERRRKEWEDEIERMRSDFFQLKPDSNGKLEHLTDKLSVKDNMDDAKTVVEKDQNGQPVFRARFNVNEYKPEEVNVKMETDKLIVNARHEEKDGSKAVSREYSREVNIPKEVDPMALQCTISKDGVLTVEAPLPVPGYQALPESTMGNQRVIPTSATNVSSTPPPRSTPPMGGPIPAPPQTHTSTFTTFMSPKGSVPPTGSPAPPYSPGPSTPAYSSGQSTPLHSTSMTGANHTANTSNFSRSFSPGTSSTYNMSSSTSKYDSRSGSQSPASMEKDKKYRVEIDIEDFNPEDLNVKTVDKKLVISARKEERIGTRTSSKELNREFHLPDTVDPMSVKAFFSDSGKLLVEAPYLRPMVVGHYPDGRESSPHFGTGSPLTGR